MSIKIKWSRKSITILRYIMNYQDRNGFPPSLMEIQRRLHYKDYSTAKYHVNRMIQAGLLSRESKRARSIRIVDIDRALSIVNQSEWRTVMQSRRIDPTSIYEENELNDLLNGLTDVTELKEHGLVGSFENGYWGGNAIESIDRLIASRKAPGGKKRG